jgi:phosphinothricin acetyltransferase
MNITLVPIRRDDRKSIVDIFNYYVENSFAAFPDEKLPYEFFDGLLKLSAGLPAVVAKDDSGKVVGFGLLRPHNPFPVFSRAADITYFIAPGHTGKGVGSLILAELEKQAASRGIATILAPISSLNEQSITFHKKHGFVEVGRFKQVGQKKGRIFDVVWMQKNL